MATEDETRMAVPYQLVNYDSYSGFFFRKEFAEIGKMGLTAEDYREFLFNLVEIACYGSSEVDNPYIRLCLNQVIPFVRAANRRYDLSIKNGKRGGRKRSFTDIELINAITQLGLSTQKELADHFKCTVRTIARRVKAKNVAAVYQERKAACLPK